MLGVLVLGFVGAGMTGACGSSEPREAGSLGPGVDPPDPLAESPLAIKRTFPLSKRASLGPNLPPDQPLRCLDVMAPAPCMRYRIQLMGNPKDDPALRAKYKAAFGSACYVSEAPTPTFNCFYKDPLKACEDGVLVPDVFGAAEYDKNYKCQEVKGTKDWWRQVGPDPAIKIDITYDEAPLETSLIDVNGVPTAINGPYRNLPEPSTVKVGGEFDCASGQVGADGKPLSQKEWIRQVNSKAHGGVIHSDLEGFEYPCNGPGKPMCIEPLVLNVPDTKNPNDPDAAQVHHVVRKTDLRGCKWGTNLNKNAAVISARLNQYLYNKYPSADEVTRINAVPPYTP
jgi:hypothetical protein